MMSARKSVAASSGICGGYPQDDAGVPMDSPEQSIRTALQQEIVALIDGITLEELRKLMRDRALRDSVPFGFAQLLKRVFPESRRDRERARRAF